MTSTWPKDAGRAQRRLSGGGRAAQHAQAPGRRGDFQLRDYADWLDSGSNGSHRPEDCARWAGGSAVANPVLEEKLHIQEFFMRQVWKAHSLLFLRPCLGVSRTLSRACNTRCWKLRCKEYCISWPDWLHIWRRNLSCRAHARLGCEYQGTMERALAAVPMALLCTVVSSPTRVAAYASASRLGAFLCTRTWLLDNSILPLQTSVCKAEMAHA